MPMLKAVVKKDEFRIITSYGSATFTIHDQYAEVKELKGVYAKQSQGYKDHDQADRILDIATDYFDDRLIAVIGEAPLHCPEAFIIGHGRISGLDVLFRNAELSDHATINIPTERVSPGALSWPRTWFLIIAQDGAWLTTYTTILQHYNPTRLVDIGKTLAINLPKDLTIRVK